MILVTGGAGFIGSNLVHHLLRVTDDVVINLDKLTYAGNLQSLASVWGDARHVFVHGDIVDGNLIARLLAEHQPRAVLNLAAESHVDRSIHDPESFMQTNVVGTFRLLEAARAYWATLPGERKDRFRFLQVSTDEVYGSLASAAPPADESAAYAPNSPYAASKAAADHLARSFHRTYGLPVLTTNCSNNYGAYQFPEKLIPLAIHRALAGEAIPIYGDGGNVRDWLFVDDHCDAIARVLADGRPGETYNIGASNEIANIALVRLLCAILDEERPRRDGASYARQIAFVTDRPGHDRRYAIDAGKIRRELGWMPRESFASGLRKTVRWYLDGQDWVKNVTTGAYREWIARQYGASADRPQGDHPGGRHGNATLSAHQGGVETAAAGL
ncbi:MAG TPA: dTDP-glucose 4,6-dehydratase [Xanthobacteraceae bacterium]|nr:dTDP-glucose 4,6-dehydratase [Xanthobacteraceae bacterium]